MINYYANASNKQLLNEILQSSDHKILDFIMQ